jgi:hypothetical protein
MAIGVTQRRFIGMASSFWLKDHPVRLAPMNKWRREQ